jgi:putative ABC transport system permease protein
MPVWMSRLAARTRGLFRRRQAEAELEEELQFHLAEHIDASVARGIPLAEARRAALRDLGGVVQTTEAVRDVRTVWLEGTWRDLRHAVRALVSTPGFTGVAIGTLALIIAVAAAVFAVVDTVIIRGLPFDDADRLVAVGEQVISDPDEGSPNLVAPQNFLAWRERQRAFTDLAAAGSAGIGLAGDPDHFPETLAARRVTANLFDVLQIRPAIGRAFTADHEVAGRNHVAVISHGVWQRRFGGAADIVGRRLPGQLASFEIVGVMPPGFSSPVGATEAVDVWVPYVIEPQERVRRNEYSYYLQVVGRLRDGITLRQAQLEMDRITAELSIEAPSWFEDRRATVERLQGYLTRGVRRWMEMLLGAVVCVLLIGCLNLTNLTLARASWRRRELAVRAALGASGGVLARIVLMENLVLSVTGTLLGLLLASGTLGLLRAALPPNVPLVARIALDGRVVLFALGVALLIGVVLAAAPIAHVVRPASRGTLTPQPRGATRDRRAARVRSALVVAEIAGAAVLLVGAVLFASSFSRVASIDLGFDARDVVTIRFRPLVLPGQNEPGPAPLLTILDRARAFPGVDAAALTTQGLPLRGDLQTRDFTLPESMPPVRGDIALNAVSPEYFRTLRMPLLTGRGVEDSDRYGGQPVVVLNRRAASSLFGGDAAIGRHMRWRGETTDRLVVGIVGDIRYDGPETDARPQAFVPFAQMPASAATLLVRTHSSANAVLADVRAAFAAAYPRSTSVPVDVVVRTLDAYLDDLLAQRRLHMGLLGIFGLLGVTIAGLGLYGVLAYLVSQRTQEIGVRMALGAVPRDILLSVLGQSGAYLAVGLPAGLIGAWMLSTTVRSLLFDTGAHELSAYALVAVVLTALALVSALIPARRAAAVDPIVALRVEG